MIIILGNPYTIVYMNKKRDIAQDDFNDIRNGYRVWYNGEYLTHVNEEWVGLLKFSDDLRYYIR